MFDNLGGEASLGIEHRNSSMARSNYKTGSKGTLPYITALCITLTLN